MSTSAFTPTVLTLPSSAAGSGQGELNLVTNPSAVGSSTAGWLAPSATLGTGSGGGPLNPTVGTYFTIINTIGSPTESSTSGAYSVLTLPSGMQNRKLKVEFYFTSPATDTFSVSVYKGTTRVPLTTDSTGATNLPKSTTGKFTAYFDTDSSGTWTVSITRTAGTGSTPLQFTNVVVGPGIQPQGAVVGPGIPFTPTALTSATLQSATYWRVGDRIRVSISWDYTGNAGLSYTPGQVLPLGLTINEAAMGGTARVAVGSFVYNDSGTAIYDGALIYRKDLDQFTVNLSLTPAINDTSSLDFELPIAEWAGSGTVQLAQNDVEYAASTSGSWDAASSAAQTVYGPTGAPISGALTVGRSKIVRFQTPIQTGDKVILEYQYSSTGAWVDASQTNVPFLNMASQAFGGVITAVSGTDVTVSFQQYAIAGTTWNSVTGATNWGVASTPVAWRVRKSSAGAAVGFGVVVPGTSSGLVSASGLPGNTTGNAIAAGYVGETFQIAGSSAALSTSVINLASQAVTPGIYFVTAQAQILTGTSSLTYLGVGTSVTSGAFEASSRTEISTGFNNNPSFQIGGKVYYITNNSTIYLVGQVAGTVGTGTWYSAGSRLTIIRIA